MTLLANTKNGNLVFAESVDDPSTEYFCTHCKSKLVFVNASLKVKHFRHIVLSNCDPEPETIEHLKGKKIIFEELSKLNIGNAILEPTSDQIYRADVLLKRKYGRTIVFEVQATNYDIKKFHEKIFYYAKKGYLVIYLFVPGDFLKITRPNIYSLKEIEKRVLIENYYGDNVLGGYLDGDKVLLPSFLYKYSKGKTGYCSSRFIIDSKNSRKITLVQYLKEIQDFKIVDKFNPECNHDDFIHLLHRGKIIRYKRVCRKCGKFIKWLSKKEESMLIK